MTVSDMKEEEMLYMPVKRTVSCRIVHLILLSLMTMSCLSACVKTPGTAEAPTQISLTFSDYMDQSSEVWLLTGKKEYSVQAMMVSGETSFHNELEVTDYTVTDDGITVCEMDGASVRIADKKRAISDCLRFRSKMDREIFNKTVQSYIADPEKSIPNLMAYAKPLRVANPVWDLIGVWL